MSDEHFGEFWFQFGGSSELGYFDIANHDGDVMEKVCAPLAEKICKAHNESVERALRRQRELLRLKV